MRAGRRTQVVKGAVCKTAIQRFEPARRLQIELARPHRLRRYVWQICTFFLCSTRHRGVSRVSLLERYEGEVAHGAN